MPEGFAKTPEPPYYAVIFTSQRKPADEGYAAIGTVGPMRLTMFSWAPNSAVLLSRVTVPSLTVSEVTLFNVARPCKTNCHRFRPPPPR